MSITRGTEAMWTIPLYDDDGAPLVLESMTIISSAQDTSGNELYANSLVLGVGGSITSSSNMALGSGGYTAGVVVETIPATETVGFAAGQYVTLFTIEQADGSFLYPIPPGILQVIDPASTSTTSVRSLIHGLTRRDIRRKLAISLNDYYRAVDLTGGETGQLTDTVRLARETDHFKGMQVHVASLASPNYNHLARVTRSDGPTARIYFEPPFSVASAAGEEVDLYNYRSRGWTVDQYNDVINIAIGIAREQHAMLPHSAEVAAFSHTSPYIDIPEEFTHISGVEATDSRGRIRSVDSSQMQVDRGAYRISIRNRSAAWLNGLSPVIRGYRAPAALESDDDRTSIPLEWLMNECKAQLLEQKIASGMPVGSQDRIYLQERTEAGGKRPMILTRALPNTIRLY